MSSTSATSAKTTNGTVESAGPRVRYAQVYTIEDTDPSKMPMDAKPCTVPLRVGNHRVMSTGMVL